MSRVTFIVTDPGGAILRWGVCRASDAALQARPGEVGYVAGGVLGPIDDRLLSVVSNLLAGDDPLAGAELTPL